MIKSLCGCGHVNKIGYRRLGFVLTPAHTTKIRPDFIGTPTGFSPMHHRQSEE
jgi:hypothetical protein